MSPDFRWAVGQSEYWRIPLRQLSLLAVAAYEGEPSQKPGRQCCLRTIRFAYPLAIVIDSFILSTEPFVCGPNAGAGAYHLSPHFGDN